MRSSNWNLLAGGATCPVLGLVVVVYTEGLIKVDSSTEIFDFNNARVSPSSSTWLTYHFIQKKRPILNIQLSSPWAITKALSFSVKMCLQPEAMKIK